MSERERNLIDRVAVVEHLAEDFGLRFGSRMFEHAVKALGIKPLETRKLESPQKGRVGLYDPLLAWLLYAVNSRCKGQLTNMEDALAPYRLLWERHHESWYAHQIPGFSNDAEYGAWLLMLTSPDFGPHPSVLFRKVREKPGLLELTRFQGCSYLENVFLAYRDVYAATLATMELRKTPTDPTVDEQREQWTEAWIQSAGTYFEGDEKGRDA